MSFIIDKNIECYFLRKTLYKANLISLSYTLEFVSQARSLGKLSVRGSPQPHKPTFSNDSACPHLYMFMLG